MKVLAKTVGPTLVCLSGDFLDAYEYRVVEYDNRVRDWNNRKLLEIKSFIKDGEGEILVEEEKPEVVEVAQVEEEKPEVVEVAPVEEEKPVEEKRVSKKKSRR